MRKLLNISPRGSDYSADTDNEEEEDDIDSDSETEGYQDQEFPVFGGLFWVVVQSCFSSWNLESKLDVGFAEFCQWGRKSRFHGKEEEEVQPDPTGKV